MTSSIIISTDSTYCNSSNTYSIQGSPDSETMLPSPSSLKSFKFSLFSPNNSVFSMTSCAYLLSVLWQIIISKRIIRITGINTGNTRNIFTFCNLSFCSMKSSFCTSHLVFKQLFPQGNKLSCTYTPVPRLNCLLVFFRKLA